MTGEVLCNGVINLLAEFLGYCFDVVLRLKYMWLYGDDRGDGIKVHTAMKDVFLSVSVEKVKAVSCDTAFIDVEDY